MFQQFLQKPEQHCQNECTLLTKMTFDAEVSFSFILSLHRIPELKNYCVPYTLIRTLTNNYIYRN